MTPNLLRTLALMGTLCIGIVNTASAAKDWPIITRDGTKLMEGNKQFRFLGFAAPNLQAHENDVLPDHSNRFPDEYEIRDMLGSLQAIGSRVTRSFALNITNPDDKGIPAYVTGHRQYNEEAFKSLDLTLALAHEYDVRVMIPIIASQSFPVVRGVPDFARLAGKDEKDFWTDAGLKEDFKHYLNFILNRRNTVSGILYKDDPAIFGWQLGNEFDSFAGDRGLDYKEWEKHITEWSLEMAAYIKSIDSKHLIIEAGGNKDELLATPYFDALSVHLYEYWSKWKKEPYWLSTQAKGAVEQAKRLGKPLLVDEFGLGSLDNLTELVKFIREEDIIAGGLLWSLRCHRRYGGFYLHNEGGTPTNSFHWPGFSIGDPWLERPMFELIRRNSFAMDGRTVPPMPLPTPAPVLYTFDKGLGWRGSTHASGYVIEKSSTPNGPWTTIAAGVPDTEMTDPSNPVYRKDPPVFWKDLEIPAGGSAFFRVRGANGSGYGEWSNILEVSNK